MLERDIRGCTRCGLAAACRGPVPGSGNPKAQILVVGQSPGTEEDGRAPFLGRSGALLRSTFHDFGIDDAYYTNAGKCHPEGNRKYRKAEQAACLPWLEAEVALWEPNLDQQHCIVAVGADALAAMRPDLSLSEGRSADMVEYAGRPLTAILHPAAALRDPRRRADFEADVERLAIYLGVREARLPYWQNYRTDFVPAASDPIWRGALGLDTEFHRDGTLIGWSFSWARGEASYVSSAAGLDCLVDQAERIILHSAQADVSVVCKALGRPLSSWPWDRTIDTCIAAYVLREPSVALKDLTWQHFGVKTLHFEDVAKTSEEFAALSLETQTRYAAADPDFTRRLWFEKYAERIRI